MSASVDWLPEVGLAPDQPPEALQEVALVVDQVSTEDSPLATDVGFAASDTVGTDGHVAVAAQPLESALPPPPQAESPRPANRAANAKSVTFDTTTPRSLVTLVGCNTHIRSII